MPFGEAMMICRNSSALVIVVLVSIGMFWSRPASVPTGAIEFADATADVTWSMPMPSAASASGLTSARTANFWAPKTCTSPTPSIVESAGAMTCSAKSSSLGREIEALCIATSITGASAGLTLR